MTESCKRLIDYYCLYSQENLAFGKRTDQISTGNGFVSSRAVDSNSNTRLLAGSTCASTQRANQPWWRVDLGREGPVSELYIVNRGDCCGDQLKNFEIRVGRSGYSLFRSRYWDPDVTTVIKASKETVQVTVLDLMFI